MCLLVTFPNDDVNFEHIPHLFLVLLLLNLSMNLFAESFSNPKVSNTYRKWQKDTEKELPSSVLQTKS